MFTDPQISEAELTERGIDYICIDDHGKSILMKAKAGYVKIMASRETGQVLGAERCVKDAGELIHSRSCASQCP